HDIFGRLKYTTSREMKFDEAASALWASVYTRFGSKGKKGLVAAALNRAEVHVRRLALVYALLDEANCIRLEHLEAALALWDYAVQCTQSIFGKSHKGAALGVNNHPKVTPIYQLKFPPLG